VSRPYQIVLDTNVLVAAFRSQRGASNKLLSLLNDPRWQINLSTPLVLEYEEALKRPGMIEGFSDAAIDTFLAGLCAIARHHDIFYLWRPLAHDPDDDFLLELAIRAQADFIVTYNASDLLPVAQFGIALVTAKEFLQQMGELP
jgi:putative PIN family toxin of toxin-antitoxin system